MTTAFYRTGTVAVTQNSKVVTGTGTNWTTGPTKPLAGDVFIFNNKMYEIDSVVSDTEIRLYRNFEDSTASSKSYAIMRNASLNISARIAAQVAQVVNQKQIMIDEFHDFLTNNTDSTVPLTDTLGNTINVTPIPMLDKDYVEKIGGIDAAVNQAIQDINDKFDSYEYILMREAEARAIQWQNENVNFDASGFVHMGKQQSGGGYTSINEGLSSRVDSVNWANTIAVGGLSGSNQTGTSKTGFPVTHIAGAICNILGVDFDNAYVPSKFLLPEAEEGTRIYDSTGDARGSGKASLDLKNEIDPKYGDVPTGTEAEILREAVGRAFEGQVKNGDLRLGDNGDWTSSYNEDPELAMTIAGGKLSLERTGTGYKTFRSVQHNIGGLVAGRTYELTVNAKVVSGSPSNWINTTAIRLANTDSDADERVSVGMDTSLVGVMQTLKVTMVAAESSSRGRVSLNCSASAPIKVEYSDISVRDITEEVVTHPVDLVGLEYYEEELTGRQEIFECIQSLSSTFGTTGVPTVLSTRKLSYFQQYDGQFPEVTADPDYINDRYRCVVWDDLTEPQKREVAAYMGEKLFVGVNGNVVNGRLRARTIRGEGNGDWIFIDSNGTETLRFSGNNDLVSAQGARDDSKAYTSIVSESYPARNHALPAMPAKGAFSLREGYNGSIAYQGRCFMYVVATVPRANQGAYHPDLNPYGTAKGVSDSAGKQGSLFWYDGRTKKPKTKANCFEPATFDGSTGYYRSDSSGYIGGGGGSGHPDGIFHDGITAGGLNGVIDWRLPAVANDSPEEAAKVEAKVENGTYRGLEKLVRTEVKRNVTPAGSSQLIYTDSPHIAMNAIGTPVWVRINSAGAATTPLAVGDWHFDAVVAQHSSGRPVVVVKGVGSQLVSSGSASDFDIDIVGQVEVNLSVSGVFNTQVVIGDPANILQTDALKDGWLGTWCPVIPDGVLKGPSFEFSRKLLGSTPVALQTKDDGASWDHISGWASYSGFDYVKNTPSGASGGAAFSTGSVTVIAYKAFAKQTKLSTNKPVYNAKAGLMDVMQMSGYWDDQGVLLAESTLGVILKDITSGNGVYPRVVSGFKLHPESGVLDARSQYPIEHAPISLAAPNNNSPAVKVLPYQISNNGQGSIGYQANELTWDADATNWGDDSTIKVTADGNDTFADLNGNTNLSVVHELAIPYTWTSNHARAGEQVEGVDL